MKDELSRYTLRVEQKLLDKLGSSLSNTFVPPICIEENGQIIRINLLLFLGSKNDVKR